MQGNPSQRLMACIAMAFIGHGAHAATTTMATEYPATSMPDKACPPSPSWCGPRAAAR